MKPDYLKLVRNYFQKYPFRNFGTEEVYAAEVAVEGFAHFLQSQEAEKGEERKPQGLLKGSTVPVSPDCPVHNPNISVTNTNCTCPSTEFTFPSPLEGLKEIEPLMYLSEEGMTIDHMTEKINEQGKVLNKIVSILKQGK